MSENERRPHMYVRDLVYITERQGGMEGDQIINK